MKAEEKKILDNLDHALSHWKVFNDPDKLKDYKKGFIEYLKSPEVDVIRDLGSEMRYEGPFTHQNYLDYLKKVNALTRLVGANFLMYLNNVLLNEECKFENIISMWDLAMVAPNEKFTFLNIITSWVMEEIKQN